MRPFSSYTDSTATTNSTAAKTDVNKGDAALLEVLSEFSALKKDIQKDIETKIQLLRTPIHAICEYIKKEKIDDGADHLLVKSLASLKELNDKIVDALDAKALLSCIKSWDTYIIETFPQISRGAAEFRAHYAIKLANSDTDTALMQLSCETVGWHDDIETQMALLASLDPTPVDTDDKKTAEKTTSNNRFGLFNSQLGQHPRIKDDPRDPGTYLHADTVSAVLSHNIGDSREIIKDGIKHYYKGLISIVKIGNSELAFQEPDPTVAPVYFISLESALYQHVGSDRKFVLDFALIENVMNHFTVISIAIDPATLTIEIHHTDTLKNPATSIAMQQLIKKTVQEIFHMYTIRYYNDRALVLQHENTCGDRTVAALSIKYNPNALHNKKLAEELFNRDEKKLRAAFLECHEETVRNAHKTTPTSGC